MGSWSKHCDLLRRTRIHGRVPAGTPSGDHEGMVPARVRAVRPRPRSDRRRGVDRGRRRPRRRHARRRRGALGAARQPAHRGQPPVLLPHGRAACSAPTAPGGMGSPLDRRGRSPLDGDLRLPHGHSGDRPASNSSAAAWRRCRAASPPTRRRCTKVSCTSHCRNSRPASRTAPPAVIGDPAGYEVMMRVAGDENLHQLFYRDLAAAAIERRSRRDDARDRATGGRLHDARHRHPEFRRARQAHRRSRHLRPRRAPRADPRAGRDPHVERRARHRSRPPRASRPATG